MSQAEQKIDPRDVREGGWYWVQQELLYVFTPLVGPDAAWLYTTMCQLIPQAIENPLMELTFRLVARTSGQSVGTVHRNMRRLIAVGMIEEERTGKGKPSTYKLVSLRKLAGLGTEELRRRLGVPLGVPLGNTADMEGGDDGLAEDVDVEAESGSGSVDTLQGAAAGVGEQEQAGRGEDEAGVPGWNAGQPVRPFDDNAKENAPESEDPENEVFQKGGGCVPKQGGLRSKTGGVAFQNGAPLIKNIYLEKDTPPTPPDGGVSLDPVDSDRWSRLKLELKSELYSISQQLARAKRFAPVEPSEGVLTHSENDYDVCFRDWWLDEVRRLPAGIVLGTSAEDETATAAGIAKYQARLERLGQRYFGNGQNRQVSFELRRAGGVAKAEGGTA